MHSTNVKHNPLDFCDTFATHDHTYVRPRDIRKKRRKKKRKKKKSEKKEEEAVRSG